MPEVQIEQSTPIWHIWRKGKLSASKSAIILGLSPYLTPLQLFEEEIGIREPKKSAPHMQRGLDIEDEARHWFYRETGQLMKPATFEHEKPIFIASLDGYNEGRKTILEIKNNNKEYHESVKQGRIPESHYCQLQHQMFVTELDKSNYLSYRKGDEVLKVIKRNDDFIADMIEKELEFKRMCDDLIPPPLTDRDYEDVSHDLELEEMILKYNRMSHEAKSYENMCKELKDQIKERVGNKNSKGKGFKLTKYASRAIVDYDKLIANHCPNVNLKEYTKPTTYAYRITMER